MGLLVPTANAQTTPQPTPYVHTIAAGSGSTYTLVTQPGNATPPNHGTAPGDGYPATDSHVAFKGPIGMAVDGLGNLYIADSGGTVRRVDAATGNIRTFAGGITKGSTTGICNTSVPSATPANGDGCPANEAYTNSVQGIAIDPKSGDIYLADATDNRIRKIDHATYLISTVAGTGTKGAVDGPLASGTLNSPRTVALDKYGNVYIGEGSNYAVRAAIFCDPTGSNGCNGPLQGQLITVVNNAHAKACTTGMGITPGTTTAGAVASGMDKDLAFDKNGNLYVADASCNYVYKVAVNSTTKIVDSNSLIYIVAGNGLNVAGATAGVATTLPIPAGSVKADPNGNLYIGESQATYPAGSRVWFYDATTGYARVIFGGGTPGDCYGLPGSGTAPYNGCDGVHSATSTTNGTAVALDNWGNLYISDVRNYLIHKLSQSTNAPFTTTTPAGQPNASLHFGVGDNLASVDASLAPDFTVAQGGCAASAAGDNTQACTLTVSCLTGACSDPSSNLYEPLAITSKLGASAKVFLSNQPSPVCQPPIVSNVMVPLTGATASVTLPGQLGAGCAATESNAITPHVLSFQVTTNPTNGTLSGSGANLTYTPNNPSSLVPDTFKYKVTDTSAWTGNLVSYDTGSSNITLASVAPLPSAAGTVTIVIAPAAQSETVNTFANTDTPIKLTSTGNGTLTYTVIVPPTRGTLTGTGANLTYKSATAGDDSFQFTVGNEAGTSVAATVTIHVAPEQIPVPNDQTVSVPYNTSKSMTLSAVGSGTITYNVTTPPAHGTLSGSNATWTYTPADTYIGDDSLKFTATNNLGTSSTAGTVTIHVNPPAPVALDQNIKVVHGVATPITLTASGSGTLVYTLMPNPADETQIGPSMGTLTGTPPNLTYTTTSTSYLGPDVFWFKVSNGLDSNVAAVNITVTNPIPVPTPSAKTVPFNTPTPIELAVSGVGTITVTITTPPAHGTIVKSGTNWMYTPETNFAGADFLYYTASNDGGTSAPAKLPINVQGDFLWTPATPGGNSTTVSLGGTATYSLLISGWTGATDSVTFVCDGAPMPCTVTPNPTILNGTTGVPVTVSVNTANGGNGAGAGFTSTPTSPLNGGWPWIAVLGGSFIALMSVVTRNRKLRWQLAGGFAALVMAVGLSSCGVQQSSTWNTPSGVYSLKVTATSGGVTRSYPLTLTVTK